METSSSIDPLDFAARFQRTQGRTPRTVSANTKVTRAEHRELEAAAGLEQKALGEWARDVLLTAARGQAVDPAFTEVVAMRMLLNSILRRLACGETMTPEAFNAEMQAIRAAKHKAAEDVMQQYSAAGRK